jgi:hypothetical protein
VLTGLKINPFALIPEETVTTPAEPAEPNVAIVVKLFGQRVSLPLEAQFAAAALQMPAPSDPVVVNAGSQTVCA